MRALLAVGLLTASAYGASTKVPEGVKVLRDLEYAQVKGVSLKLDLYRPSAMPSAPMPLVIWVHGGGWRNGSKVNCPAAWLATKGYAVASLDFRLLPEHPWPAQIEDPIAALRWLHKESGKYGYDASRSAAMGGSSGGHVVALWGTLTLPAEDKVKAVVDLYGPTDLLTMPPNVLSGKRTRADLAKANGALLLGGIVMDQPDKAKAVSALHQVSKDDVPFLILHGTADPGVPVDQSERLHAALKAAGVESTLKLIPGAGHGGKEFDSPESRALIQAFLDKHLHR
ncbi:MAG: alpha/beta hydrolase [Opitutales bacterium]|jgi:acetyl esterase/lipase|nr:alpha/beta hydrolase [Opitutales bacterium]MDP4775466.1 alpha/beta hydrolase [Opitutales bacterium]MDP4788235.1 alpha/beta hydrolase [Opitutales bacterium]MDP4894504.1 alpha/beta hydrolase [Opitutales bacterium]